MIGPSVPGEGSEDEVANRRDELSPEVRWGVGCLVGAAAITGVVILLMYVAFTVDVPVWVQLLLGVSLTVGGGLLSWLVVRALGESKARAADADPKIVQRLPRTGGDEPTDE